IRNSSRRTIRTGVQTPLTGDWVLVSPHRAKRPWQGQTERREAGPAESSPVCMLIRCARVPLVPVAPLIQLHTGTYLFDNDFPALMPDTPAPPPPLLPSADGADADSDCGGVTSPWPGLPKADTEQVIRAWMAALTELAADYDWVQILENRGAVMGCSNPHAPLPDLVNCLSANRGQLKRTQITRNGNRPMLVDYVQQELRRKNESYSKTSTGSAWCLFGLFGRLRLCCYRNGTWLRLTDLNDGECLAEALKCLLTKYDNLFECSFPYSHGFHGAPTGSRLSGESGHWQLHAVFYPPLLRSATVKKFMVGYEMLAEAQRDLTRSRPQPALESCLAIGTMLAT
uniref:UDP-glucose--hexose-1-phosphate uridylyltransferase n=1 Tax=Macrostomum lignano TaxID=282301 RepID=A0A1I8FU18_9PLAT